MFQFVKIRLALSNANHIRQNQNECHYYQLFILQVLKQINNLENFVIIQVLWKFPSELTWTISFNILQCAKWNREFHLIKKLKSKAWIAILDSIKPSRRISHQIFLFHHSFHWFNRLFAINFNERGTLLCGIERLLLIIH